MKQETRNKKIFKLEDFQAWNEALILAEKIYELTKCFPKDELFGLTNQLRRASVSISANLAEGFGRQQSKDKEHFYVTARGSAYEVKSLLELAWRLNYASEDPEIEDLLDRCLRLIGGLLKTHRSQL